MLLLLVHSIVYRWTYESPALLIYFRTDREIATNFAENLTVP